MSWYNLAKFGQIWNVNYRSDSVQSCLEALYQLTYKYQQMNIHKFKGYPTRQENMLKGIEKQSKQIISDLVDILQPVFENWLKEHALTNPRAWAENLINQQVEIRQDSPNSIAHMIANFNYGNANQEGRQKVESYFITDNLDDAIRNNQAPAFATWFKQFKIDLQESDAGMRDESDTRPEEQINEYYQNLEFSEYFSEFYGNDGNEWLSFLSNVSEFTDIYKFAVEIAQFGLFPAWYEYWKNEGIDQTRENVENAYNMIKQVERQPINQALATINIIINTCHQSGSMLDYICEVTSDYKAELFRAMQRLSTLTDNSVELKDWNKQLRQVGTKIPPKRPQPKNIEEKPNTVI